MAAQHHTSQRGNSSKTDFQKMVPLEIEQDLYCHQMETAVTSEPSESEEINKATFGPHPNTNSNYKFKDEVERLLYKFNFGDDVPLSKGQQDQLLNMVYDKKFSSSIMRTSGFVIGWPIEY